METEPRPDLRIILVGCVKRKLDYRAPARDLYTSDLFRKRRAYAESSGHRWFILSAEYGLVHPDRLIAPYDKTCNDMSGTEIAAWGEGVASALEDALGILEGSVLKVHAGRCSVDGIAAPLRARGAAINVPLQRKRLGEQLSWYTQQNLRGSDQDA